MAIQCSESLCRKFGEAGLAVQQQVGSTRLLIVSEKRPAKTEEAFGQSPEYSA